VASSGERQSELCGVPFTSATDTMETPEAIDIEGFSGRTA